MKEAEAKEILRGRCFGLDAHQKWFGEVSSELRGAMEEIPCGPDRLYALAGWGTLIAFLPQSVHALRTRHAKHFSRQGGQLYMAEREVCSQARWYFVYNTPRSDTAQKDWPEQREMTHPTEVVPEAAVLVAAMLGQFLLTRETPFADDNATLRTPTEGEQGRRVAFGYATGAEQQPLIRASIVSDHVASSRLFAARAIAL